MDSKWLSEVVFIVLFVGIRLIRRRRLPTLNNLFYVFTILKAYGTTGRVERLST